MRQQDNRFATLGRIGALVVLVCATSCKSGVHGAGGPDGQFMGADACATTFTVAQPCGGTVQGSGDTPSGKFTAGSIQARLGDSSLAYRLTLVITDVSGQATMSIQFRSDQDAGAVIFRGPHQASGRFSSAQTCTATAIAATVEITSGDAPDTAVAAQSGTVGGTFSVTDGGFSVSGSFQTPYCGFDTPFG